MSGGLDDTSGCPLGVRCESCGLEAGAHLAVYTSRCALGVMCLTMCPRCGRSTADVNIAVSTASRLVTQHASHLGIGDRRSRERPRIGGPSDGATDGRR